MKLALLLLCSCNSILGLETTRQEHVFFDAMPDAPFGCPASGPPAFSPAFTQILSGDDCHGYTTSRTTQTATAQCTIDITLLTPVILQGPADSNQIAPAGFDPALTNPMVEPKLAPDGDELWVAEPDGSTGSQILYYQPSPPVNGMPQWITPTLVLSSPDPFIRVGTPTRAGTSRRVMYLDSSNLVHELAQQPDGSWTDTPLMQKSKIETFSATSAPNLTPDGMHMVFAGSLSSANNRLGVVYAARASLDVPFTFDDMAIVDGAPDQATTPFLTEDCSRVYFSGLSSVFYVTEQLDQ
jgi:hypothetical protein